MNLTLSELIGQGYGKFFKFKGRYRIDKGSRNSKKSVNMIGRAPVWDILSNELNNVMILRAVDKDNRQSTFVEVKKAIRAMGIWDKFKIKETTMEIKYKPTGQIIFFRGANDPDSITSVSVEVGVLNRLYIEEAFQIKDYETFRKIDGSFRGDPPNEDTYWQITLCFNPWIKEHWIYHEFFEGRLEDDYETLLNEPKMEYIDEEEIIGFGRGLYLMTTNYKINEFRDKNTWDVAMEEMRKKAPDIFRTDGLGMWGAPRSKTYRYWNKELIKSHSELLEYQLAEYTIGIDIGCGNGEGKMIKNTKQNPNRYRSAMTMSLNGLTADYGKFLVFNEFFYSNEGQSTIAGSVEIAEKMILTIIEWQHLYIKHPQLMKKQIVCYVDSADPGGFRTLLESKAKEYRVLNIRFLASTKNKIQTRVDIEDLMMAYGDLLTCEQTPNLNREFLNATCGADGEPRADIDDHVITAFEYGIIPLLPKLRRWKDFKER